MEVINDFVVLVASIHSLTLLASLDSIERSDKIGLSLYFIVLGNLGTNLIFIYGSACLGCRLRLLHSYKKHTVNSKLWDRRYSNPNATKALACTCQCFKCGTVPETSSLGRLYSTKCNNDSVKWFKIKVRKCAEIRPKKQKKKWRRKRESGNGHSM